MTSEGIWIDVCTQPFAPIDVDSEVMRLDGLDPARARFYMCELVCSSFPTSIRSLLMDS